VSERLERLVNLTATLLDTRRPLTLDELASRLEPSYPDDMGARRRAFERDKETLRDLGVPISTESVEGGGEVGYRIRADDYYLPDPGLSLEERAALNVAVSAVRLEGSDAYEGMRKLGGFEGASAAPLAELTGAPLLGELFEAVARRRELEFGYRDEHRRLAPYGVVHRFGHWYVVGHDRDRDAPRAFRVDRIEGKPVLSEPNAFEPPPGVDPADFVRDDPLAYGEAQPVEARVLVDATHAAWVIDELGAEAVEARRPDGSVIVVLSVVNREAFRSWVLELLSHAEVLSPPELRDEIVEWLRELAGAKR
jgi:predicted DNA-binding transcriptional regulator YafY